MFKLKFAPIIVLLFILTSCATQPVDRVIYKTTPLSLPTAPLLPTWKSVDMQCLPIDIKQKMLERDRLRREYIEQLQIIIKSTN